MAARIPLAPALAGGLLAVLAALAVVAAPARAADRLGERTLQRGHRGADVRELQRTLNRLDLRSAVDGVFAERTEELVRRYERREEIAVDGQVSRGQARGMRRRAGTLPFGGRPLRRGARGGDVRRLQRVLTQLGMRTAADGVFGSGTERRVERYERREDISVDGRVSRGQARGMIRRLEAQAQQRPAEAAPPPAEGARAFPINGAWRFGDEGAHFGDRGGAHKGEDVFADCGTPLVAAETSRAVFIDEHAAAGHYVVLRGVESGEDHVYMHLQAPTPLRRYATVNAGEPIGAVGRSGNATACHLHFEIWTAPGWYEGGAPYDPMPSLKRWAGQG